MCFPTICCRCIDVKVVQNLLGHAHIETTMNIYTHVTTEQVEKTTDLLINFLNEPKNISSYSQNIVTSEKKP
nr:tyrosine-type recombinase/integrase [Kurthia huakuii]